MVLNVFCAGIPESRRVGVGSGERAYPAPPASIAVRNRDERTEGRVPRSKTTEESLLRRFGHSVIGDSRISPWWGAKRGVGTRLPGCPSPFWTAMDVCNAPKKGAQPRGGVFPEVVHRFWPTIGPSLRAGSRNARGAAPLPGALTRPWRPMKTESFKTFITRASRELTCTLSSPPGSPRRLDRVALRRCHALRSR